MILATKRSEPFKVLKEVIRKLYDESRDEKEAERWLKKNACS